MARRPAPPDRFLTRAEVEERTGWRARQGGDERRKATECTVNHDERRDCDAGRPRHADVVPDRRANAVVLQLQRATPRAGTDHVRTSECRRPCFTPRRQ